MMIDLPAHAIEKLRAVLQAMDSAYKQHGTESQNPHYAMYFDTPDTEGQDPIEYEKLNRNILKQAHELKITLRL